MIVEVVVVTRMEVNAEMSYHPKPIDTSEVMLGADLLALLELLGENSHDVWARKRIAEGWRHGPRRDDAQKLHPCLVPYGELSESDKEYDREMAVETLKVIIALGYQILHPSP